MTKERYADPGKHYRSKKNFYQVQQMRLVEVLHSPHILVKITVVHAHQGTPGSLCHRLSVSAGCLQQRTP